MNQFGLGCNWFGGAAGIPRRGVWLGKVSTILAGFFLMGIGKMIEGNKKRLRVPRKKQVEKNDRRQDCRQEFSDGEARREVEHHVDDDAQDTSGSVIDDPCGGQEVAWFALVSVTTSRTAIERHEPVPQ